MPVELIWDGKYDAQGKRVQPVRLALPFQTIETVNESNQQRQQMLDLFSVGKQTDWRNRLIWGDKKYVLPSLLEEFRGKVDLIYIDPPFATGADFSFTAQIPDDESGTTSSFVREVFQRAGSEGATASADVLGWDFAFELNETGLNMAREAGVEVKFRKIPREVLEKKAVDQGDIRFVELGAVELRQEVKGKRLALTLADFLMPQDDIPADVQGSITHWSQLVDYWAVDWDFRGDTFHNQWQAYRTHKQGRLETVARHEYGERGRYTVLVKVIDLLGNDTTKTLKVEVM
ncbi:MAG: hypothetical protein ACR2J4_04165 [Deinococcus sp.]